MLTVKILGPGCENCRKVEAVARRAIAILSVEAQVEKVTDRAAIMRLCCRQVPLAPDVDIPELARRMEGLTGADVESLCKKATLLAIAQFHQGTRTAPFVVGRSDFLRVLESAGADRVPD